VQPCDCHRAVMDRSGANTRNASVEGEQCQRLSNIDFESESGQRDGLRPVTKGARRCASFGEACEQISPQGILSDAWNPQRLRSIGPSEVGSRVRCRHRTCRAGRTCAHSPAVSRLGTTSLGPVLARCSTMERDLPHDLGATLGGSPQDRPPCTGQVSRAVPFASARCKVSPCRHETRLCRRGKRRIALAYGNTASATIASNA
jgi:hypothetical protein